MKCRISLIVYKSDSHTELHVNTCAEILGSELDSLKSNDKTTVPESLGLSPPYRVRVLGSIPNKL